MGTTILIGLFVAVVLGFMGSALGEDRKCGTAGGFLLGFFLSILGIIVVLLLDKQEVIKPLIKSDRMKLELEEKKKDLDLELISPEAYTAYKNLYLKQVKHEKVLRDQQVETTSENEEKSTQKGSTLGAGSVVFIILIIAGILIASNIKSTKIAIASEPEPYIEEVVLLDTMAVAIDTSSVTYK